jgi:DNA invertase Pin-like site-specific DNA recombinase
VDYGHVRVGVRSTNRESTMKAVERPKESRLPAAEYLRASTEHQQYSTTNQRQAIAQYAMDHNLEVVQTYTDEARSGLGLKHRLGLQRLLQDVVAGTAAYKAILVYDVSRWGRFLDTDESAHYEFLCKSAGVPVHYCAEIFGNDTTLPNLIMKAVKRTMAGEYSRELSTRVFRGMDRLVRNGFRSGGRPGYGLSRMLVAADGSRKQQLKTYERKSLTSDRVVYVLGPPDEVQVIRNIYRMFVQGRMSYVEIARTLNDHGTPTNHKNPYWTSQVVGKILSNPKYAGAMVYNRTTRRLQSPCRILPKSEWIVVPDAFEAIVDHATYQKSQAIRDAWVWNRSDADLLDQLRVVLRQVGKLSSKILAGRRDAPSDKTCRSRFGSLTKAYELIGYRPAIIPTIEFRSRLQSLRKTLMEELIDIFPQELSLLDRGTHWRPCLRYKDGLMVSVRACRSLWLLTKGQRWVIEPLRKENGYVTLLALLNSSNTEFEKFVMLPRLSFRRKVTVGPDDPLIMAGATLTDLSQFLAELEEMRIRRCGGGNAATGE